MCVEPVTEESVLSVVGEGIALRDLMAVSPALLPRWSRVILGLILRNRLVLTVDRIHPRKPRP